MIDTSSVHPPRIAVLFVLATVPLLFGAVHPIVQSGYVCLVLAGLGGWLLLHETLGGRGLIGGVGHGGGCPEPVQPW